MLRLHPLVLLLTSRSQVAFGRIREDPPSPPSLDDDAPLTTRALFTRIQKMLDGDSAVIAETGDSWFNGVELALPQGARFEVQMQYGSIGWSVGATLGYALGDWRLVAGGVAGLGVERARPGARPAALLVHAGLAVALAARISGLTPTTAAVDEHNLPPPPPRPKPSTHVVGSALGLDDDSFHFETNRIGGFSDGTFHILDDILGDVVTDAADQKFRGVFLVGVSTGNKGI